MDGDNVVPDRPKAVRRRSKKPRFKTFRGASHLFTASIAGYEVPVFTRKDEFDGDAVGMWWPGTHELAVVLPGQSPVAEADRLWHEFLHAISTIILPPDKRLDETQVNAVATAQIDLLQRNPTLAAFILSRLFPEGEATIVSGRPPDQPAAARRARGSRSSTAPRAEDGSDEVSQSSG